MEGIQYKMNKIKVFVTYAWGNNDFNKKVLEFVQMLRKKGFDAVNDKKYMQESTAVSFPSVMSEGLSDFDKVIVILTKDYKEKITNDSSGVNTEYQVISSEIRQKKYAQKYILVSFGDEDLDEIVPPLYKGLYVVDLKKDEKKEFNELFSKLLGENIYEFSEVAEKTPEIKKEIISEFSLQNSRKIIFQIDRERTKVTYGNETKNSLREWIADKNLDIEVVIDDLYVKSFLDWKAKMDELISNDEELTEQQEQNYNVACRVIQTYSKRGTDELDAIKVFLHETSDELRIRLNSVNQYLKVIENIILIGHGMKHCDFNEYFQVDGWTMVHGGEYGFKAHIHRNNSDDNLEDSLLFRDARYTAFSDEDIFEEIVPNFCLNLVWHKNENKKVRVLINYVFGRA